MAVETVHKKISPLPAAARMEFDAVIFSTKKVSKPPSERVVVQYALGQYTFILMRVFSHVD